MNERRNRISPLQVSDTLADVRKLSISIDDQHEVVQLPSLARGFKLTACDSTYLEVALRAASRSLRFTVG